MRTSRITTNSQTGKLTVIKTSSVGIPVPVLRVGLVFYCKKKKEKRVGLVCAGML